MQWCKVWTLEPWRPALSRFPVWESVVRVWARKLLGQRCLSDCTVQSSVTFDEGGLWCGVGFQELDSATSRSIMTRMSGFDVEESDWPAQC